MCELYCGKVLDEEKLDEAQIGHYIGIGNSVIFLRIWGFMIICLFSSFFHLFGYKS